MSHPYFSVKVEGEEVGDLLTRVEVEESDTRADLATLTLIDASLIYSDIFFEGLSVEIDLGNDDSHALIFRGQVTAVRAHFAARGNPIVVVEAADRLIELGLKPQTKKWWNTTASQIVRDLAIANGMVPGRIDAGSDPTVDEIRPRQQVEETDLAFLHRLARDLDCKLYLDPKPSSDTLNFVSTASLLQDAPIAIPLIFNANVDLFEARFDAFAATGRERLVTTDPVTGSRVDETTPLATSTDAAFTPDSAGLARPGGAGSDRLAKLVAIGAAKRAGLSDAWQTPPRLAGAASRSSADTSGVRGDRARRLGQSGQGRVMGDARFRPRKRVTLQGFGGRWSGDWYLTNVRHEIDLSERRYWSHFRCAR